MQHSVGILVGLTSIFTNIFNYFVLPIYGCEDTPLFQLHHISQLQSFPGLFLCRLYGIKCAKCNIGFSKNDFVMRARSKVYHIECFRCVACSRQLIPGDEFALREDGLFCRADHDVVERATLGAGDPLSPLHPARPLQMAGRFVIPTFIWLVLENNKAMVRPTLWIVGPISLLCVKCQCYWLVDGGLPHRRSSVLFFVIRGQLFFICFKLMDKYICDSLDNRTK